MHIIMEFKQHRTSSSQLCLSIGQKLVHDVCVYSVTIDSLLWCVKHDIGHVLISDLRGEGSSQDTPSAAVFQMLGRIALVSCLDFCKPTAPAHIHKPEMHASLHDEVQRAEHKVMLSL